MPASPSASETLLRQLLLDIAQLSDEDLPLAVEFISQLVRKPRPVRASTAAARTTRDIRQARGFLKGMSTAIERDDDDRV